MTETFTVTLDQIRYANKSRTIVRPQVKEGKPEDTADISLHKVYMPLLGEVAYVSHTRLDVSVFVCALQRHPASPPRLNTFADLTDSFVGSSATRRRSPTLHRPNPLTLTFEWFRMPPSTVSKKTAIVCVVHCSFDARGRATLTNLTLRASPPRTPLLTRWSGHASHRNM